MRLALMPSIAALGLAVFACTGTSDKAEDSGSSEQSWSYPLDDVLRITDGQAIGTHNSYHLEPTPLLTEEWAYSHEPLDVQLGQLGVRQVELDVWYDEDTEGVSVMHVPIVDQDSTCPTLLDCLDVMLQWSEANPAHFPLFVMVEPKDEVPEQSMTYRMDLLEETVRAGWPAEKAWTPDDQQGGYGSLRESVVEEGWPLLQELRGKAIFLLLDSNEGRTEYLGPDESLAGKTMFVRADAEDPLASVFTLDGPTDPDIPALAEQGFLIRTRTDAGGVPEGGDTTRLDQALASGAHWLSTDFPAADEETGYVAVVPDGSPVGCNPVTAPAECTAEALEDPAFIE